MPRRRAFVAIDLGATSGRVMLSCFENGRLDLTEVHRFTNEPVAYNGELHWNVAGVWQQIRCGLDAVSRLDSGRVESVGADSWGVDYALLGEGGVLLGNPYHYRDARTDGMMEQVCGRVGAKRLYERTGVQLMPINTLYQLYAAQQTTPRLLATADHLVMIPDLINYWLCGVVASEYTIASTTQMLAHDTRGWANDLLGDLDVPTHLLPRIVPPGTILGPLRDGVCAGLPGVSVVAPACHDTGSAVAAVRASGDTAFLSSGTWSLLGTEVAAPVVSARSRDLNFTNEGGVCGTIRLLRNITGLWLLEGCRRQWAIESREFTWDDLLGQAHTAVPLRSLIDPDDASFVRPPNMPQAIAEFCARTDQPPPRAPGEFVRAILEGLALKYRFVLEQLETITGAKLAVIRVIGGGARNALLNQLTADATGRSVIAGPAEATALGNAAMQMLACGAVRTLEEARDIIDASQPPVRFEPRPSSAWEPAYERFRAIAGAREVRA